MVSDVLFSSNRDDWETPQPFFDRLDQEFSFTLDPCANDQNHKCALYYTRVQDGLARPWTGHTVWVNPPYGKKVLPNWVRKCWLACQHGTTVVLLIPARTDTAYWHDYVMQSAEVRLVRGRLRFVGAKGAAPFPSTVVVFRPYHHGPPALSAMEANPQ